MRSSANYSEPFDDNFDDSAGAPNRRQGVRTGAHRVQRVTLDGLDHLDIGSGGHRDRAVAQNPLHRYRLDLHREEQRGTRVPKIVHAKLGSPPVSRWLSIPARLLQRGKEFRYGLAADERALRAVFGQERDGVAVMGEVTAIFEPITARPVTPIAAVPVAEFDMVVAALQLSCRGISENGAGV